MADRYQALSRTRAGALVIKRLGLPDPVPLVRYSTGEPLLSGPVVVGGEGTARADVIAAVAAAGGEALTAPPIDGSIAALVYDATWIASPSELVALPDFFAPVVRRLRPCGRVVVVGTSSGETGSLGAAVAQRSLEGFTRSLGKEVGRGSTVQLVSVSAGGAHALASTLHFLLSAKSAYVSGQVIRVGRPLSSDLSLPDLERPLEGKVALVTGAARGIGAAIARTLHRDGARVIGVDVPGAAEDLSALARELGGERLCLDITSVDAPQRIARRTAELAGGVDVVVHNAGITRDRRLANMSAERWTPVLDVNLDATLRITSMLLHQDLVRPGGRIVAVSSIAGVAGNAGQTNYAASKAGTIGFVTGLAPEVAPRQITVNAVAPGFIETRMTASLPLLIREAGRRLNSMSQGGQPIDVAETVAWLAAPGSSGITGSVVRVCGQSLLGA
jgi:3-oxoacyl-[acyl-carrier protein] reductase